MVSPVSLVASAPAKINLHLGVGAPRTDGFHPLDTVYHAIGLVDSLTVEAASPGVEIALTTPAHIDASGVPLDASNIVDQAARLLGSRMGVAPAVRVRIDKAIPVAGGMAGGSADAGAALRGLHALWVRAGARPLTEAALLEVAAELGSDVPFTLVGGTARGVGRGEIVTPLPAAGTYWWVVVPSAQGLSTPAVYRHFDVLHPHAPAAPAAPGELLVALAAGDVRGVAAALHNDLGEAALDLRPSLGGLIARGESEGALRGIVSGSGPTVVFLCGSEAAAYAVADGLRGPEHPVALVARGPWGPAVVGKFDTL